MAFAIAALTAVLFVVGVVALGRVVALTSACRLHEAREGTGYEKYVGFTVDEFAAVVPVRYAVRSLRSDEVEPGRIARVSSCNAPRGADVVVSVARP